MPRSGFDADKRVSIMVTRIVKVSSARTGASQRSPSIPGEARLETLDRKRAYLIQSLGFNNTPEGMNDCFQWCDHSGQLKTMWNNLLNISKKCQQQNLSNGAITQLKYRHAGRAMNIIQGSRRNSETYNTKGQSHRHANPNKLASA